MGLIYATLGEHELAVSFVPQMSLTSSNLWIGWTISGSHPIRSVFGRCVREGFPDLTVATIDFPRQILPMRRQQFLTGSIWTCFQGFRGSSVVSTRQPSYVSVPRFPSISQNRMIASVTTNNLVFNFACTLLKSFLIRACVLSTLATSEMDCKICKKLERRKWRQNIV